MLLRFFLALLPTQNHEVRVSAGSRKNIIHPGSSINCTSSPNYSNNQIAIRTYDGTRALTINASRTYDGDRDYDEPWV